MFAPLTPEEGAWYEGGKTDPKLALLRLDPEKAEIWLDASSIIAGIKKGLEMQSIGLGMVKTKRLNPLEIFGGHGVKDLKGFHAIVAKAKEIEDRKKGFTA